MKGTILLNYSENTKQVEKEEESRFLKSVLEPMGIPLDFWTNDGVLSVNQKIKLREVLHNFRIQIIDDLDSHIQVYFTDDEGETHLIGEWHKPTYKLKRDLSQLDPKKQLYLEMEINCWTMAEDLQQEQ